MALAAWLPPIGFHGSRRVTVALHRFWKALESAPGLALVTAGWRETLGNEYEKAARFLRPTNGHALSYPCPSPGGEGCPRRVVFHGPGDIVATCQDIPRRCDLVKLTKADIAIWEVNLRLLGIEIARALGVEPLPNLAIEQGRTAHLGTFPATTSDHRSAYLALPRSQDDFLRLVATLVASAPNPVALLTAVSRHHDTNAVDLLRDHGSHYFALDHLLTMSDDGVLEAKHSIADLVEPKDEAREPAAFVFRCEGDTWEIRFDGTSTRLKSSKGLRCLHVLLQNPRRDYHLLDLEQAATPPPAVPARPNVGADLGKLGDLGPMIDAQTKNDIRGHLGELRSELDEAESNADQGKADRLKTEIEQIQAYLDESFGLGGRPRRQGNPTKQARDRVTHAIRTARRVIARELPDLDRHLQSSIVRGSVWSYRPERDVDWQL